MPAGLLVTVPSPLPCLFTVNVNKSVGAGLKTGNAVKSVSSVMVQGPVPPHLGPFHPENIEPAAGVGVKVTTVPVGNPATHVGPQSMPAGWLVTVPDPMPFFCTVRFDELDPVVKVAVTDGLPTMTTTHVEPLPLQPAPLNPLNAEPLAGAAESVTVMPVAKSAAHVPGHEIPVGLLVTIPIPFPPKVTVSRLVEIGTSKRAVTVASPVTLQGPVPEQAPPHPTNAEPGAAAAFKDTTTPC
jgi:hypothetical protein